VRDRVNEMGPSFSIPVNNDLYKDPDPGEQLGDYDESSSGW
jgi:hypothetical protein